MRRASLAIVAALAAPAAADGLSPLPLPIPPPAPAPTPEQPTPDAAQPAPAPDATPPAPAPEPAPPADQVPASPSGRAFDGQVYHGPIRPREIVVEVPGRRSRLNRIVLWSTFAAGAAIGALGAYWNVESRDAADEVSASRFTGRAWTAADDATVARGERAGDRAAIAYTIGGALLAGTITAFLVTAPKPTREVIRPHFAVGPGGGVIGGAWAW